ncbi:hypothetical protein C2S51_014239 [Perilla frutescens var. frutescens]|nr:hypothetical protein C2S51_014239 [Perilla frutescens var. frutescens]
MSLSCCVWTRKYGVQSRSCRDKIIVIMACCEMGLGVRSSSCRHRTVWTPEMDRYFIDLMLEQVREETRGDDNLFSKRAWKHMTAMFNAKFSSKYEKDVLKNRHKMLRNLYRALSSLLEQKGFRWDESGQMVAADNRVWDNYIQAHPHARPYRLKTVPYYPDLVKIYGTVGESAISRPDANCNESMWKPDVDALLGGEIVVGTNVDDEILSSDVSDFSLSLDENVMELGCASSQMATESLHDIMIDVDYGISVAKETADETYTDMGSTIGARSRTYWQPPMDHYFIQLMLDQVSRGNHIDGLLRKQAWREMISSFNAKFGLNYAVGVLKNRYKTLRRQHSLIKNLLEADGFTWDDARRMVTADDRVWQNYIKAHTGARQYMTRPVPHYEDLCSIFRELNGDEKPATKILTAYQSPAASASDQGSSDSGLNTSATHQSSKRQPDLPPIAGSSKKPRRENEGGVHTVQEMATGVSSLADKRREDEDVNTVPVELVVAAIQALPEMDEELVLDACDFLEDSKKAKTFLALDVKLRKKWLVRKLRNSQ